MVTILPTGHIPVVAESTPIITKIANGHDSESALHPVLTEHFCNIHLNIFQIEK
jgi:hypothetical protein